MHPLMTQAIAAERTKEVHAHAAAAERARQFRRPLRARRTWLWMAHPAGPARAGLARTRPAA
jgi:hypothetical protein